MHTLSAPPNSQKEGRRFRPHPKYGPLHTVKPNRAFQCCRQECTLQLLSCVHAASKKAQEDRAERAEMAERERASPTAVSADFLITAALTVTKMITAVLQTFFFSPQYCFPSKKCNDPPRNSCRPDCCNVDVAQVQPTWPGSPFSHWVCRAGSVAPSICKIFKNRGGKCQH